jgi:hypothetical protein
MSALAIAELLSQALGDLGGRIECGDMAVREERGDAPADGIFARLAASVGRRGDFLRPSRLCAAGPVAR